MNCSLPFWEKFKVESLPPGGVTAGRPALAGSPPSFVFADNVTGYGRTVKVEFGPFFTALSPTVTMVLQV